MSVSNREVIEMLKAKRQRIAFDANIQRVHQINTPHAIKCLADYEKITRQISELEGPQQGKLFKTS